jgi:hypothetical protein
VSVFISWSGEDSASRRVAEVFKKYIPKIIQGTSCYVSTQTEAGQVWVDTLFKELEGKNVGLLCVTRENYDKPWVNFEAGALAKNYTTARVCPILIDLQPADITGPLTAFQMKRLTEGDVFSIFEMLNVSKKDAALTPEALKDAFDAWWPKFDADLKAAIAESSSSARSVERSQREILEEILETVRALSNRSAEKRAAIFVEGATEKLFLEKLFNQKSNSTAEDLHLAIIEKFRNHRPLILAYVEAAHPALADDVLLLFFSDGQEMAYETLSRPNNFKYLQQLGLELGISKVLPARLKTILEAVSKGLSGDR